MKEMKNSHPTLTEHYYYLTLNEVVRAVSSAHTTDSVLRSIPENVTKAIDAKGCSLMLFASNKKHLLHTVSYGLSDSYMEKGPLLIDKSMSEAMRGKPVTVLDATTDNRIQYQREKKQEGIASILSVPMRLRDKIIGVVRVYTAKPRQFTEDDIYFVTTVANLGAIALENARRYDSVQKDYNALRQELL